MATLVLRLVKGSPLTNQEVDNNFSNLNADIQTRILVNNIATNAETAAGSSSSLVVSPAGLASILGSAAGATLTTSARDTTVGRVARVGDWDIGIPAAAFDAQFGQNGDPLDPRITFTRSSQVNYIENMNLKVADVNEPVFESGGLRISNAVNNIADPQGVASPQATLASAGNTGPAAAPAYTLTAKAGSGSVMSQQSPSATNTTFSGEYTLACFAKAGTYSSFALDIFDGVTDRLATFDLAAGILVSNTGTYASITPLTGGWYWCTMTLIVSNGLMKALGPRLSGAAPWVGTESLTFAGLQFNRGAAAQYVPAGATINADRPTIYATPLTSIWNQASGAIVMDTTLIRNGVSTVASDSALLNGLFGKLDARYSADETNLYWTTLNDGSHAYQLGPRSGNMKVIVGISWNTAGAQAFYAGAKVVTVPKSEFDAQNSWGSTSIQLPLSASLNQNAKRLRLFTTCPTDAQMQAMTALGQ